MLLLQPQSETETKRSMVKGSESVYSRVEGRCGLINRVGIFGTFPLLSNPSSSSDTSGVEAAGQRSQVDWHTLCTFNVKYVQC
jgi:hypothetical protein